MNGEDRGVQQEPAGATTGPAVHVRTFLIADIRGYSQFTQERGDEAAARLAAAFAEISRQGAQAFNGDLIELRGDEALVVFASARGAIRAAVDLQERYAEHSQSNADLPLPVGIGLDAGEAVPVGDGFRGGALNVAARLCSIARPGEILATDVVAHLASKIDGVVYTPRGEQPLKGIDMPVRVIGVAPEGGVLVAEGGELVPVTPAPPAPYRQLSPAVEPDEFIRQFGNLVNERVSRRLMEKLGEGLSVIEVGTPSTVAPVSAVPLPNRSGTGRATSVVLLAMAMGLIIVLAIIAAIVLIVLKLL